jgi:prepilin-type N-terminal cleavage/methylation domain-containing protein
MAEDLMAARVRRQAGFSMVEMLMAAFILAIGILGLSMLQVMSMRASRGSRSLTTAVQVAELMLDQVESEGRLSWLNVIDTEQSVPTPLPALQYVNQAGPVIRTFTIKGRIPDASSTDPADVMPFFTATLTRSAAPVATGATQSVHDFSVNVSFADTVEAGSSATIVQRNVVLRRRIVHG